MNSGLPKRATIKASGVSKNLDCHFDLTKLVAAPALLTWFDVIGYTVLLETDIKSGSYQSERRSETELFLYKKLCNFLLRVNPKVTNEAIAEVIQQVTYTNNFDLLSSNRYFHKLLTTGVDVVYQCTGQTVHEKVWLIDWLNPLNNDWLVIHEFNLVQGSYTQNLDLVVFINGLPLAVLVWNHPDDVQATLKATYQRLQTYLQNLPQLFIYNTFLIIACGNRARVGTITSTWQEFLPWRTIDGEDFPLAGETQLDVLIQGIFDKRRFLELVKYFIVFEENTNSISKKFLRHPFCTIRQLQSRAEMGGNYRF